MAGALIDGFAFLVIVWVSLIPIFTLVATAKNPSYAAVGGSVIAGFLSLILLLVAQIYLLVARGQTVGKLILGMRILRPDGSRVGAIPVVGGLFQLINPLMIFRESRRCWHDDIADTIVIRLS